VEVKTNTWQIRLGRCAAVVLFFSMGHSLRVFAEGPQTVLRPRVIVTTDGEIDDRCSMVRFLLYANEWDIRGLIHSSSKYHWKGDGDAPGKDWQEMTWLDAQLDAYAEVYPNLKLHDPGYPSPEYLRSQVFVGNIDLEGDMRRTTPGSERIVEVLLDPDVSPVWLQAWGGPNTIARALKTIKEEHPGRVADVSRKARIYLITEQDMTFREYIRPEWPGLQMLLCKGATFGAIAYHWRSIQPPDVRAYFERDWLTANILQGHGPLCGLYEAKDGAFRSEGDSPAFLHLIDVGLRSGESPAFGGWGGRFSESNGVWKSVDKDGVTPHTILRWAADFQNDWAARADWCVKNVAEANHPPVAKVVGSLNQRVRPGQVVKLVAEPVDDPDGDQATCRWWQYREAGTASAVAVSNAASATEASFTVPPEPGGIIHILLEVTDNGSPPLRRWQRVIYTIDE
jgi:Cellulose-binding Sde182, nucleoside hydrolase-like domain/Cellulose-binding protein Sde0182, C-terminal domain